LSYVAAQVLSITDYDKIETRPPVSIQTFNDQHIVSLSNVIEDIGGLNKLI